VDADRRYYGEGKEFLFSSRYRVVWFMIFRLSPLGVNPVRKMFEAPWS